MHLYKTGALTLLAAATLAGLESRNRPIEAVDEWPDKMTRAEFAAYKARRSTRRKFKGAKHREFAKDCK